MKALCRSVILALCFGLTLAQASNAAAQSETAVVEAKAVEVADNWLKLVDNQKYKLSWAEAATFFKDSISQEDWTSVIAEAREPMGALKERVLLGKKYLTSIPNAPEGEYVVIQYKAVFEGTDIAFIEVVTPMKDTDGLWRVSGYYIFEAPPETPPAQ